MNSPAITVQGIHFDDYDGTKFERLVFAYHIRTEQWLTLDWYGQTGSDLGRDIWGVRESIGEKVCIQCANRKSVRAEKAIGDIDKILKSPHGKPDVFRFVCAASVSAKTRDSIKAHGKAKGICNCEIWSGPEFEERLRARCDSLLKRFVGGESFPDEPKELRQFAQKTEDRDPGRLDEVTEQLLLLLSADSISCWYPNRPPVLRQFCHPVRLDAALKKLTDLGMLPPLRPEHNYFVVTEEGKQYLLRHGLV